MPLPEDAQLVSTDDHLVEHPKVWADRLPARYQEAAPRIVTMEEDTPAEFGHVMPAGSQGWLYEGRLYAQMGLNAVAGKRPEEYGTDPLRFDDMRPGCYDPKARVADMDEDGVAVAMCFPTFPRFGGTLFSESTDPELGKLCISAWNDFVLDEWCAEAPERFIPLVLVPFWDVAASVAEIERVAVKGGRALSFPENPVPLGYPSFHSDHWGPLWSALEDAEIPLCLHFGSSGQTPITSPDAPMAVMTSLMGCNSMFALADLAFSSMFDQHPRLKVALSEGGIGWIPYLLERMDYTWQRHRFYQEVPDRLPSEIYRDHIWGCFISDDFGVENRHSIGVDKIMWECDYPHSDSNWPNSRKVVAEMMLDVPDDEVRQIVETNARTLFRMPRALTR